MIPRKHIPPGVKLFDTKNARSELFPAEEMASRRRRSHCGAANPSPKMRNRFCRCSVPARPHCLRLSGEQFGPIVHPCIVCPSLAESRCHLAIQVGCVHPACELIMTSLHRRFFLGCLPQVRIESAGPRHGPCQLRGGSVLPTRSTSKGQDRGKSAKAPASLHWRRAQNHRLQVA